MPRTMAHSQEIYHTLELQVFRALQDYLVEQGELLPVGFDRSNVWQMLDVACGTGQWVREVAWMYPDIEVVGLDTSAEAIAYAQMLAHTSHIDNAVFLQGNMFAMNELQDNSFDLVHARFLALSVQIHLWPVVLQELHRVCRPGGTIIWTETTFPTTGNPGCHQWCELMQEVIVQFGYTPNVTPYMQRLLNDTGCCRVQKRETSLDISASSPFNQRIYRDLVALLTLLEPVLASAHSPGRERITNISRDAIIDLYDESFQGEWALTTVMCEKAK